ncbi:MAG: hypothetical protein AAGB46_13830 [Verrucomicrobiota bacterium]
MSQACPDDGSHRFSEFDNLNRLYEDLYYLEREAMAEGMLSLTDRERRELIEQALEEFAELDEKAHEKLESFTRHWKLGADPCALTSTDVGPKFEVLNSMTVAKIFLGNLSDAIASLEKTGRGVSDASLRCNQSENGL